MEQRWPRLSPLIPLPGPGYCGFLGSCVTIATDASSIRDPKVRASRFQRGEAKKPEAIVDWSCFRNRDQGFNLYTLKIGRPV